MPSSFFVNNGGTTAARSTIADDLTASSNSKSDAQKLAINAEDAQFTLSDGTTNGNSALHYSAKAAASASSASGSASTATQQAGLANDAKLAAQTAKAEAVVAFGDSVQLTGDQTIAGAKSFTSNVDVTGNVGVGTSSASSPIQAKKSTTGVETILDLTAATGAYNRGPALDFSVDFSGEYTVGQIASQNVVGGSGYGGILTFLTNGASAGTLAERMRIDSSGNVLVGTTSASAKITSRNTGGTAYSAVINSSGSGMQVTSEGSSNTMTALTFRTNYGAVGSITCGSATAYNTSSDYRLKTDAQPMTGATARLKQLNPVNFQWIADGTRVDGFLAHEAQAIVPESVTGTKDAIKPETYEVTPAVVDADGNEITPAVLGVHDVPDYQGIDQAKLVPLLVATIQELEARITALES